MDAKSFRVLAVVGAVFVAVAFLTTLGCQPKRAERRIIIRSNGQTVGMVTLWSTSKMAILYGDRNPLKGQTYTNRLHFKMWPSNEVSMDIAADEIQIGDLKSN